jgi:hypothetical protein
VLVDSVSLNSSRATSLEVVNEGELVSAVMNGEIRGSPVKGVASVSTDRVGGCVADCSSARQAASSSSAKRVASKYSLYSCDLQRASCSSR